MAEGTGQKPVRVGGSEGEGGGRRGWEDRRGQIEQGFLGCSKKFGKLESDDVSQMLRRNPHALYPIKIREECIKTNPGLWTQTAWREK